MSKSYGHYSQIRKLLKLTKKESYTKIVRIRKVENKPFMLQYSYIPNQFIKKDIPELNYYDSIYNRFKTDFGIRMYDQDSKETNEICFPTDETVAKLLEITNPEPTIRQEKRTTLEDGTVAELIISFKKWDYYKFELTTYRDQ